MQLTASKVTIYASGVCDRCLSLAVAAALLVGGATPLLAAETPVELSEVYDRVVFSPMKEYSRAWAQEGTCTVVMVLDPVSGKVTSVYIEESSGNDYLNRIATEMLRNWKFKPGTPRLIRTTFGFGNSFWRDRGPTPRVQPLNKVLEPFLGKKALAKGSLPVYPRGKPWTNKHGMGVFLLKVDTKGQVTDVSVKKSSGDAPFDEASVRAMRQWQFRKGPVEIELPLYFVLTPEEFSVRIPKYP